VLLLAVARGIAAVSLGGQAAGEAIAEKAQEAQKDFTKSAASHLQDVAKQGFNPQSEDVKGS
jgi:hypothetical protein